MLLMFIFNFVASTLKPEIKTFQINRENTKRNTDSTVLTSSECTYKRLKLNEEIAKIGMFTCFFNFITIII